MDVKRSEEIVNPPVADERKGRIRRDVLISIAVTVAVLLGGALFGLISWQAAAVLSTLASLGISVRAVFFNPIKLFGQPSDDDVEEVRRLRRYGTILDTLPQPVLVLDASDRIEIANAAGYRMFGDTIDGAHIAAVVRAPTALGVLREARHDGGAHEAEFTMAGSQSLSALFYVAPLHVRGEGPPGEMIVMVRDRTEQRKLERMRTDFIANAGHELRTPLAAILGFIETLRGHAKNDPEARERFLGIMQSQTERLLRLVKDLVSLSALELNERRLPEDEVDLCEVAAVVRELMEPVAASAGGIIAEGPSDCSVKVMGDRDQLIQVIQNLADNALKYGATAKSGVATVHISAGQGPGLAFDNADKSGDSPEQIAVRAGCKTSELCYIRVRDEGMGISKTDLPRLTERFYRTDADKSHVQGGTGLGLAIVKHIVGRHRGGILVESCDGAGSAFTCYFPPHGSLDAELLGIAGQQV